MKKKLMMRETRLKKRMDKKSKNYLVMRVKLTNLAPVVMQMMKQMRMNDVVVALYDLSLGPGENFSTIQMMEEMTWTVVHLQHWLGYFFQF